MSRIRTLLETKVAAAKKLFSQNDKLRQIDDEIKRRQRLEDAEGVISTGGDTEPSE